MSLGNGMKGWLLAGLAIVAVSGCAGLSTHPASSAPACYPLTESACVKETDYALRVRNDWDRTVTVIPWSGSQSTHVPPRSDVVISTEHHPAAPWTITVRADNAVIWTHTLRGTQDEGGPGKPPFPKVYSYYIGVFRDGTIITCPSSCGSA